MARKGTGRTKATVKRRLNLSIDAKLYRRLNAYASYHERDVSEVASQAFTTLMRGFRVGGPGEDEEAGDDATAGDGAGDLRRKAG